MEPIARPASDLLLSLMRYKAWADADLLRTVLALPALLAAPEGGYVTAIVRHFHTVDCIFKAHLLGVPHAYTSANPATLSELQPRVATIDEWYVQYARNVSPRDLEEAQDVKFTDGQEQVLTRSDILLHVSLHGAGHRGNISLLIRKLGAEPPPDRFTSYLRRCSSAPEPSAALSR
jgi:uncharacterized damage-inducible protein DinB